MKKNIARALLSVGVSIPLLVATEGFAQINPAVMPSSGALTKQTMSRLLLTDAARVGNRVIAVGDRGYIVHSESNGESWSRAKTPDKTPLLTAVYFSDEKNGWAVGHDLTILTSTDQGANWSKVFSAPDEQKPLMDIVFVDANTGYAVGAYGAFFATADGGKTWAPRKLFDAPAPKPAAAKPAAKAAAKDADDLDGKGGGDKGGGDDDKHLNAIVKLSETKLLIVGEAGTMAKSEDAGKTWTRLAAPYKGSYFGAIQAQDGSVVIYGLRGRIYRSADASLQNWKQIDNKSVASLMGSTRLPDGTLVLVGLSGTVLMSRDNGDTFTAMKIDSTKALAAPLLGAPNALLLLGEAGARDVLLSAGAPAPATPAPTAPPKK